jgi:Uma2 family endonuclease
MRLVSSTTTESRQFSVVTAMGGKRKSAESKLIVACSSCGPRFAPNVCCAALTRVGAWTRTTRFPSGIAEAAGGQQRRPQFVPTVRIPACVTVAPEINGDTEDILVSLSMVMTARQRFTFRDYVSLEELAAVKHEYLDGAVWAMAGGTPEHAGIAGNVIGILRQQLSGKPCRVFTSDLRIRVRATGLATYPDASVVCGQLETDPEDKNTVVNPRIVVEVLSSSTEQYDRGEKLTHYFQVESLEAVLLVAHDGRRVDVHYRTQEGWTVRQYTGSQVAMLEAIDAQIPLDELYQDPLAT